jgi:hypothetical protein
MTDENERQAALIKTSISSYVGTATLAVLAGAVALFTYIQQSLKPSIVFYFLILIAVIALIVSFILGGKGANATAKSLADGTWTKDSKTSAFNWQAVLTLVGVVFLIAATAVGTIPSIHPATKDPCVALLSRELAKPRPDLRQLKKELNICEIGRS